MTQKEIKWLKTNNQWRDCTNGKP